MDSTSKSLSWGDVSDGIKSYLGSTPHADALLNYLHSFLGLSPRSPAPATPDADSSTSADPPPDEATFPSPSYSDPTLKRLIEKKRSADREAAKYPTPENRKRANALQRRVRARLSELSAANTLSGSTSASPPANPSSRTPSTAPAAPTRAPTATAPPDQDLDELEIFLSNFRAASSNFERLLAVCGNASLVEILRAPNPNVNYST